MKYSTEAICQCGHSEKEHNIACLRKFCPCLKYQAQPTSPPLKKLLTNKNIEAILSGFYNKYAGKGLSTIEIRIHHFNELYNLFFEAGKKAQTEKDQQAIADAKKEGARELAEWLMGTLILSTAEYNLIKTKLSDLELIDRPEGGKV